MLKTNSKIVRERIRKWIIESYDSYNDDRIWNKYKETSDFKFIAKWYLTNFVAEKLGTKIKHIYQSLRYYRSYQEAFHDWCSGLPSCLCTCDYYVYQSAIDFLGDILEQTEYERKKFDEMEAEKKIDYLIYRELISVCPIEEAIQNVLAKYPSIY